MAYCSEELSLKIMRADRCIGIFGVLAMFTGMLAVFSAFLFSQITGLLLCLFIIFSSSTAASAWLLTDWMNQAELESNRRAVKTNETKSFSGVVPVPTQPKKYLTLVNNGETIKKEIRGVYGQKEN